MREHEQERVLARFQSGETPKVIAHRLGLPVQAVRGTLRAAGVLTARQRRDKAARERREARAALYEKAVRLAHGGHTTAEIARRLNLRPRTVHENLQKAGAEHAARDHQRRSRLRRDERIREMSEDGLSSSEIARRVRLNPSRIRHIIRDAKAA